MEEFDFLWLIIMGAGIAISVLIRLVYFIFARKNEVNFDEFDDTEKLKQREKIEKENIVHEASVMSKVYKDAYTIEAGARKSSTWPSGW